MFILVLIIQCYGQFNIITTIDSRNVSIYENQEQLQAFTVQEQYQCHPSLMFEESADQDSRVFYIQNLHSTALNVSIIPISLKPRDLQLLDVASQVEQQEIQIEGNSDTQYTIKYQCFSRWAYVELHVRYGKTILNFRYVKICEKTLFFNSYPEIVLLVLSALLVFIAAFYGQKRFKLRPSPQISTIDELESRDSFYKAKGMFSPQYSQPEQQMNIGNFTTTASFEVKKEKQVNLKVRIGLYLIFIVAYFFILNFFEEVEIYALPTFVLYFVCFQITFTDLLIFIVSSSISPQLQVPLYGRMKLINLFTYLVAFVYSSFQARTDNWVLNDLSNICWLFQIVRFMKFYNLKQLLSVYCFLIITGLMMKKYLNFPLPQIMFPNTFLLDNPKLTCTDIEMNSLMLPASLLTFSLYFCKETRSSQPLLQCGYLGFLIGLALQYFYKDNLPIQIQQLIPSLIVFIIINLFGMVRREMKQLYSGITPGLHNRAIQQQYSYELTIDKYNKNQ